MIIVVNVICTSYSGSTWLNLLLGSHPDAFSVGEIKSIKRTGRPLCTLHGENCPVWSQFDFPSDKNPFLKIAQIAEKRWLIVNNSRNYMEYLDDPNIESRYVHLLRDGRAVTASMMRKYVDTTMWKASRKWAHDVRRNQRLIRRRGGANSCLVHYEKLNQDTAGQLELLCKQLGMPFEPTMLDCWSQPHHYLGGNRGTLTALANKQSVDPSWIDNGAKKIRAKLDLDFYAKNNPARFKDERWKSELNTKQLSVFALVAGGINRRYGYPRSLDRS